MLETRELAFRYPDGTEALRGVNVEIEAGELVALMGQNASGKTTFARCLAGLQVPTAGEVLVDGRPIGELRRADVARRVGYVFQNPDLQLFASTTFAEIASGPQNLGLGPTEVAARVEEAMAIAGVAPALGETHPFFLSKGLRQRVAIASILALRPRAIVVDEPTTGQDHRQSIGVMDFLERLRRERGHAVVIITHDVHIVARYARRVLLFCDGRAIRDGPAAEVFADEKALAAARAEPPQVTRFCRALGLPDALTVDAFLGPRGARHRAQRG